VAELLFGNSFSNWFVYISKSYDTGAIIFNNSQRLTYFIIYAITSMTFSPIGEELFYRGVVHACFATHNCEHKASVYDSLAFGLTHLAHFGIVYIAGVWDFLFIPALLWVTGMFIASRLFFFCKQKTQSLLGAMICHAGFNMAMIYFIFYHIL
jgi:membrane protease YdiL (CAAX protease family)